MKFFGSLLADETLGGEHAALRVQVQKWRGLRHVCRLDRLAVALLLVGAGFRVGQYAIGAALWHDELALARNIVEKPIRELLTAPLDYTQVAPPGFLLIEKAAIIILGNNEYALRLFPLLCALASLPLFTYIARRTLLPGAALLAVALFSLSPTLVGFGSQVKQYGLDVAAAVLMVALTLWWERRGKDRAVPETVLLGAVGFVAVWFSHTTVLVLAGLGVALLLEASCRRERILLWELLPIAILWGAGALAVIAYGLQTMSPSTYNYMGAYWSERFMPLPTRSIDDALWLWRAFRGLFQDQLRYPLPEVGVLLMLLGAVTLARRGHWPAGVLLAPLGVSLVASAARQYPFGDRVSLFLLPLILLLLVEGVDRVRRAIADRWGRVDAIVLALATVAPVYALYASYPLYPEQRMPEVLAYIQANRQPQDSVYVYHGAWHAVGYYGPRYGLSLYAVVRGSCGDPRRLLGDLDQFRGRAHLWVILSHVVGPFREREAILGYLDTIGERRDSIVTFDRARKPSSSAYLYDLSDPARLRSSSASTYRLPPQRQGREYPCVAVYKAPHRQAHAGS